MKAQLPYRHVIIVMALTAGRALSHYLFVITDIHFSEETLSVSENDEQQNRVLEFEVAADGSRKSQR